MSRLFRSVFSVIAWGWRQRHRFFQFGLVGVSGVAINQLVIWICQEKLYVGVENLSLRLNLAMFTGIIFGMTNNFYWNRKWTWKDRDRTRNLPITHQYLQYATANWAGILVQVAITNVLVRWIPYLPANLAGIAVACVINFILTDLWTFRHVRTEGIDPEAERLEQARVALPLLISGLVLGLCTFLHGLDAVSILRNGDEMVYIQITRSIIAGDHWLPLQSDMAAMTNTKPPLLFWQGIISTDWGQDWNLVALRWPSIVWTFSTAIMCGLLGWRLTQRNVFSGILAAMFYLAFFSTYRYGRPYLTNPPETFWVFSCFFTMLWWKPKSFDSRFLFPTIIGVLAGMALLTKSFAQLLPIGFGLAWWHLHLHKWKWGIFLRRSLPGLLWTTIVALGMFSLWFVFDPEPQLIWRNFVMGENVGKMAGGVTAWFQGFFWGGNSVWTLAGSWFVNAGLLAFPLFGVCVECWKHRSKLITEERLLWIWVFAIFIVFCIPAQRSGRYLLEAMPAIAILMATRWHHVGRNAFVISHIAIIAVLLPIGWLSFLLAREVGFDAFSWWHWPLVAASIAFAVISIVRPRWTAMCAAPASLAVFLSLSSFLSVFNAPLGTFSQQTIDATADHVVWIPENFRSVAENHRFLIPHATIKGFSSQESSPPKDEVQASDLVVIILPLSSPKPFGAIGSRIQMTSRHTARQIWEMATGKVQEHLFCREWIVPITSAVPANP